MGAPEQIFQFSAAEDIPMFQCDPVDARPIRCRDNTVSLQKVTKPLWACGERQHSWSMLREINLRKHLPALSLRADPEDELVAPPTGLTAQRWLRSRKSRVPSTSMPVSMVRGECQHKRLPADVMK